MTEKARARWRIYRIKRSTEAQCYVGSVHAPDEKSAIEEAIKQFGIKGERRERLMALREV